MGLITCCTRYAATVGRGLRLSTPIKNVDVSFKYAAVTAYTWLSYILEWVFIILKQRLRQTLNSGFMANTKTHTNDTSSSLAKSTMRYLDLN